MRMTGVIAAIVLVVSTVGASGGQQPAAAQGGKGSQSEAIRAIADAYVKATLASDAKAIAALYTDDAMEMPPNTPMVKGRAAIEQYYQKLFGSGTKMGTFSITHLETTAVGDNGYDVGTYQQSMTPKGAAPVKETGKYTVILKRSAGAWKVAYAIYNSDQPPPPR
jgi:uncharacterized protein (TIGR02246 family)